MTPYRALSIGDQLEIASAALEAADNAIVIVNRDGRIAWVNPAFCRMTGYSREESIGENPRLLKAGFHDVAFYRDLWETILAGRVWHGEMLNRRKDGSTYTEEQTITPVRNSRGEIDYFVSIKQDVSERKRIEEELRRNETQWRTLVHAAPLAIAMLDAQRRIQVWNPAAEHTFGWSEADMLGRVMRMGPDGDRAGWDGFLQRAMDGEILEELALRTLRKDGRPVDVVISLAPLRDASGRITGIVALAADLTHRRQAEQALRESQAQLLQSQKMEAVGRLAGGIAHDFNNLLTVIMGRSQLQLMRLPADDPFRRDLNLIEQTARRASALTRQLLAFSRKQVLEPHVLDLNLVVEGLAPMLRRVIGEDIETVIVPGSELGAVCADPGQLEQVVMNLAVNARDAMPDGGRLTFETANVELDDEFVRTHPGAQAGPFVTLTVRDTGVGMTSEVKARVFEPFFTTKEVGKGTGLGLATVYGIVKQHDGYIALESAPGQGAVFSIYLPRSRRAVWSGESTGIAFSPMAASGTVLLVEDDEGVRALAGDILRRLGYTVLEAQRPADALALASDSSRRIDLLLSDVVMPQMSGPEMARRMGGSRPDLRIVYMSGYTDEALGQHGVLKPGTALVHKPFAPEVLARKVAEALEGSTIG